MIALLAIEFGPLSMLLFFIRKQYIEIINSSLAYWRFSVAVWKGFFRRLLGMLFKSGLYLDLILKINYWNLKFWFKFLQCISILKLTSDWIMPKKKKFLILLPKDFYQLFISDFRHYAVEKRFFFLRKRLKRKSFK